MKIFAIFLAGFLAGGSLVGYDSGKKLSEAGLKIFDLTVEKSVMAGRACTMYYAAVAKPSAYSECMRELGYVR